MDTRIEIFYGVWVPAGFKEANEDWESMLDAWADSTWQEDKPVASDEGVWVSNNKGVWTVPDGINEYYEVGLAIVTHWVNQAESIEWLLTGGLVPESRIATFKQQLLELGIDEEPSWKVAAYTS